MKFIFYYNLKNTKIDIKDNTKKKYFDRMISIPRVQVLGNQITYIFIAILKLLLLILLGYIKIVSAYNPK